MRQVLAPKMVLPPRLSKAEILTEDSAPKTCGTDSRVRVHLGPIERADNLSEPEEGTSRNC